MSLNLNLHIACAPYNRVEFSQKMIMDDFNADLMRPEAGTRSLLNFIDKRSLKVVSHEY